ncbi:GguC protein [Algoriphagus sp. AGSA1]|uniref:AraD1 family protein n=1 Tax=Algoriphagus sp. AGSA1 TaxID=2907213 RepID=UPI001F352A57|nr:AraD1 family protein [Algoriphagus sp. AGSA1]MCE7055236.1 GguC protein [Algoriphagus sp. AGSA1]
MENQIRLVQVIHSSHGRRIALVQEPELVFLAGYNSVYELALSASDNRQNLKKLILESLSNESIDYSSVYHGEGDWKLLPSFDHPDSPFYCMVSGTGLTHHNSALNRQMMHGDLEEKPTDSLLMYEMGVKGGSPAPGDTGVQPEWFYKGNGSVLRAHGQTLSVPYYANDGGEEPEIVGLYIIDRAGKPWRIGFSTGNEFSDHVMEKTNYLYLAPSKIRECSIGPEAVIDADFESYSGDVSIIRDGESIWRSTINSGQKNMCHNLANLEFHHFKYDSHRIPLQAHVHFFGADAFSFGNKIKLENGDRMSINWNGLGRALQNSVKIINPDKQDPPEISAL